jgi:glycosyltransferase involved in cell wall biosynthesis
MTAQVTIIVPIYKVEKYLRSCFDSLLRQTSQDYTILAVNDGSPDGCDAIIREYVSAHRNHMSGIRKENGGYGSVLQLAIAQLTTPYFLICDPDDTLDPKAVETLLKLAKVSQADITIGAKMIMHEGESVEEYDASYNRAYVTLRKNSVYNRGTEAFNDLFFVDPSPHAKLYRADLAKDIHFPEHVSYTDNMLFDLCLLKAEKVIYTDEPLAHYLVNRTGNSMTDISYPAMNGQILVFKSILTQAENTRTNIPDMFWYRMYESFKFMLYQLRRMDATEEQFSGTLDYLETYLQKLTAHDRAIRPLYRRYTKSAVVERLRDEALMSPRRSESAFQGLKKRMVRDYQENQSK